MSAHNIFDYTFLGLCDRGKLQLLGGSLAYLVGLVPSANHEITDFKVAKTTLRLLYDLEEQAEDAAALLELREVLSKDYNPQTPVMVTQAWSPVGAMLERGFEPLVLRREDARKSFATGIWSPATVGGTRPIPDCRTPEELFWSVLAEAVCRATDRKMLISIIAAPGWAFEMAIGSLPKWTRGEIANADRILWARTPSYSPDEVKRMIDEKVRQIAAGDEKA